MHYIVLYVNYTSYYNVVISSRFRVRIRFSIRSVSGYADVFVLPSVQFTSYVYIAPRSNSLDSHECNAVKSRPSAKRNSDVFSLRWNCPSVGVASRND